MALGFIPSYKEDLPLGELTQEHFLALAIEIVEAQNWKIAHIAPGGFIAYTNNGVFKWNAEVRLTIENSIATIISSSTGSEIMDLGKNKKNIEQFISILHEKNQSIDTEILSARWTELRTHHSFSENNELLFEKAGAKQQFRTFFSLFIPRANYIVTPILVDINLLLFVLMAATGVDIFMPDSESLIRWGADFTPMTLEGQWWRLITCCFLHIGIVHLLMNMYALTYIGFLLEPYLGTSRFLIAYILSGITGSITSLWWHDITVSAGASGAIFGMYGVFLALLTTNFIEKSTRKPLLTSIGLFVAYNLAYGMKGGVDNAAHVGGLIGGLLIGYSFIPGLKNGERKNFKYIPVATTVILLLSSIVVYLTIPNEIGKYNAKMEQFSSFESKALEVYDLPDGTPDEKVLYALNHKGIFYWNESIKLIDETEHYNIPKALHDKNKKLKQYCELRIKVYSLIYKAVEENTDQYTDQIDGYNAQIESIIKEMTENS